MRRRAAVGLGAAALALGVSAVAICQSVPEGPLDFMPAIEAGYPGVAWISAEELAAALEGDVPPVLLDVRTEREFEVSHLAGAIRVEPGSEPSSLDLPPDRPVVVYCSVGYRSARVGQALKARGRTVHNLAGGLFQWANEGRPMVREGDPTDMVHPYDPVWGRLVDPERRAPLPADAP